MSEEPEIERLHAAMRLIRLQGCDKCDHCGKDLPDKVAAVIELATPPGSTVATLLYTCSPLCKRALFAAGWTKATPAAIGNLKNQLGRFGMRVGETQ